ncbi:MAG: hypothetical protein R3C39_11710 [Dehalococcoidia bacterium]
MSRAVTHIHTEHSWDGTVSVPRLASMLIERGIELAVVSDHNSFAGSLELRALIERDHLPLRAPVAAEIRTDLGDVLVAFEDGTPPEVDRLLRWDDLQRVVRERGGLIWLPHPYRSHTNVEAIAAGADVIEVFNGRCSPAEDASALELCGRHGATPAYGADLHRPNELNLVVAEYEDRPTILETLRGTPRCPTPRRTRKSDIMAAEVINGIKRRRPTLVGYFGLKWVKHRALEVTGRVPREDG